MSEVSENMYLLLAERSIHDRMEDRKVPYNVVGGLGLHAVTNAAEIDWDNHVVYLPSGVSLPCLRENGTVRDLDTLVQSTDKAVVKSCRQEIADAIGDKLVVSAFGLNPYKENRRGIFDFVGEIVTLMKKKVVYTGALAVLRQKFPQLVLISGL